MSEMGIGVAVGLVCGIVITWVHAWSSIRGEWRERRKIERRLAYLESHLCCGQGIFGCTGGPSCGWDHK
jgi:hypothetical protein